MSAHIETVDSNHEDQDNNNHPHSAPQPTEEARLMIKAIDAIIKLNIPSKVKLHDPNAFDASDPHKLHTFLLQCKLNVWDCQDHFQDDSVKVSYVLSFLKGTALECFKPGLLADDEPAWLFDFGLFIQELKANFSTSIL